MNKMAKKYLGLSLLPLSFVFLFNPDIAIFDFLPDLIGYLILCSALINLADMNYYIADACALFKKAALISLGRIVSIILIYGFFGAQEHSVSLLLFSFVFGVLDLVVLIPAYKKLFEGLLYAGNMCDGEAVFRYRLRVDKPRKGKTEGKLRKEKKSRRNITAKASSLSVAFAVIKVLCSTLPEFTSLIDNSEYEFISLLRSASFVLALAMGIAWLVYMVRYVGLLKRDKSFIDALTEKYNTEIYPKTGMFTSRQLRFALSIASAAFLLTIDLYSDNINFLPDLLCAAVFVVFFVLIRHYYKKYKLGIALSVVTFAVSAAEWIQSLLFYTEYYPEAVRKNIEAYLSYYIMFGLLLAKTLLMLCLIGFTFFVIFQIARRHTGRVSVTDDSSVEHDNKNSDECKEFKIKLIIYFILAVLSAAMTVFNVWSQTMRVNHWLFEAAPIIDITFGIVFAAFTVSLIYDVKKEIQYKYMLD